MKIYIDRGHCSLCQQYCDRHSAKMLRFPLGEDRPCIQALEEDGTKQLVVVVRDGDNEITLHLDGVDREVAELEGLSQFLPWANKPA
jgi:hypothetical protein